MDFTAEKQAARAIQLKGEAKRRKIVDRENEYQRKQFGAVQNGFSDEAVAAMRRVKQHTDDAVAAIAVPVVTAAESELRTLTTTAVEAARAFLDAYAALAASEHALADYLSFAGLPARAPLATGDADAGDFIARSERRLRPPTPRPVRTVENVLPPNFNDLVAS